MKGSPQILSLALAAGILAAPAYSLAAPQFLISWHAASYAPAAYAGKILPTAGTPVTASLEVLSGGKLLNLARTKIYWYANDTLIQSGEGAQDAAFIAPNGAPSSVNLRVELPDYQGANAIQSITIPVVSPVAAIALPFPKSQAAASFSARALPYFFNTTDPLSLQYSWTLGGQPASADAGAPYILNASLTGASGRMPLTLDIVNPASQFEGAETTVTITPAP